MDSDLPRKRVRITRVNLHQWPAFQRQFERGLVVFDKAGRLRYTHGAPVGDMILVRVNKNGQTVYEESAEEWFAPASPRAATFKWPE